jgi:hypothetical protein
MDAGRRTFLLRTRPPRRVRRVRLTVRVTNAAGQSSLLRRPIRIRRKR